MRLVSMTTSLKSLQGLAIACLAMILSACQAPMPIKNDPYYAPVLSGITPKIEPKGGGLYIPEYGFSLFTDARAHRVGDLLTIVLDERTVSSKSAETSFSKESDVDAAARAGFTSSTIDIEFENEQDFEGESDAEQSNSLEGNIAVTVVDVLPNGVLVVRGEKWLTLTRGDEFIRISGLVRPEDIQPDNSVRSTRLADARIMYSGTGELADANQPGWLQRFFISPIWPF